MSTQPSRPIRIPTQVQNLIDLARWYKKGEGWPAFKRQAQAWEHREMTRFGAPPTACPSDRIPWDIIIPAVEEKPDMPEPTEATITAATILREFAAYVEHGMKPPAALKRRLAYIGVKLA